MMMAPSGVRIISAVAPTETPPARVAFWMCSMQNLLCKISIIVRVKIMSNSRQIS